MQKYSVSLSFFPVILLLILLAAGQGCSSKRLAKQAQKLEDAGMYEMAAENYFRSYSANRKNIEAATGLRRNAQRTLDLKANTVNQAYLSGNDRETVYSYLGASAYRQRIMAVGIELAMPAQSTSYYEEAKPRFLDSSFEEARLLLDEENFRQAESIFMEIKNIDPSYQDLSQFLRISQSEPLYRQGVDQLRKGFNRKAYDTFSNLLNNLGPYKDAKELRDDALANGMISIAISEFRNSTGNNNVHATLKSLISAEIINLGNPFIQIVDDINMETFLREQEMASRLGSDMKIGRLMAAKALLTGNLHTFTIQEGKLERTERKAYLKEVINTEHPVTKEKSTSTTYHKVTYFEYHRVNKATGSFQYQLSSTETGAVLLSGIINLSPSDKVHYATFEGNTKNLVPGHWEYSNKTSPKDVIQDENVHVNNLQAILNARKEIKSPADLRTELTNSIASAVSKAVNDFNPEL